MYLYPGLRKVVQAVLDGGGKPFITDLDWDVSFAERRGYTSESVGCPIYPAGGIRDRWQGRFLGVGGPAYSVCLSSRRSS